MKKAILLLTFSSLVLGFSVLKLTERSPSGKGVTLAALDLTEREVTPPAEVFKAVEAAPAPVMVAAAPKKAEPAAVVRKKVSKPGPVSREEAVMIALKSVPGEAGEVEYKKGHYRVKIYPGEGKRAKVYIEAVSGEVTRIKMKS